MKTKEKIAVILVTLLASVTILEAADYGDMQAVAKDRLLIALKSGKQADIAAASATVESLSRARYLDDMSKANETIMPLIEGFAPQLAALPDAIKGAGIGAAKSNPAIPQFAVQMLVQFLSAQNAQAAKEAVGQLAPAIVAMDAGDNAARQMRELQDKQWRESEIANQKARLDAISSGKSAPAETIRNYDAERLVADKAKKEVAEQTFRDLSVQEAKTAAQKAVDAAKEVARGAQEDAEKVQEAAKAAARGAKEKK